MVNDKRRSITAVHIKMFLRIIEADVLKKILLKSVSHDF